MNAAKSSHPAIRLKMMRYEKETDKASITRPNEELFSCFDAVI
jgi:hypothetical protein